MGSQRGADSLKVKVVVTSLFFGLALCLLLGRPLYWQFTGKGSGTFETCSPCACDCLRVEEDVLVKEVFADLKDFILSNCGRDNPEMQEELQKTRIELLQEELTLLDKVSEEAQRRVSEAIKDATAKSSQFEKEFDKCNEKMMRTESAREKAQVDLIIQRKNRILWESRARTLGWKDDEEFEGGSFENSRIGDLGYAKQNASTEIAPTTDLEHTKNG